MRSALLYLAFNGLLGSVVAFLTGVPVTVSVFGALPAVWGVAGAVWTNLGIRVLRRRWVPVAVVVLHGIVGAVWTDYAFVYANVLAAMIVLSSLVETRRLAIVVFVLAAAGFAVDAVLHTGLTTAEAGSIWGLIVEQVPILAISYAWIVVLFRVLQRQTGDAVDELADIRSGRAVSYTPGLTAAVRGERPVALLNAPDAATRVASLSAGERAVLDLLASGLTAKQIARDLHLSLPGVRSRIASAKRTLGARTLEHLVVIYIKGRP